MYIRMYVCMYVCMYICMYVLMYACMYVCMHVCLYVYMYVCIYVCMYLYITYHNHLKIIKIRKKKKKLQVWNRRHFVAVTCVRDSLPRVALIIFFPPSVRPWFFPPLLCCNNHLTSPLSSPGVYLREPLISQASFTIIQKTSRDYTQRRGKNIAWYKTTFINSWSRAEAGTGAEQSGLDERFLSDFPGAEIIGRNSPCSRLVLFSSRSRVVWLKGVVGQNALLPFTHSFLHSFTDSLWYSVIRSLTFFPIPPPPPPPQHRRVTPNNSKNNNIHSLTHSPQRCVLFNFFFFT